jgi:ATP-dependent DNA helicase RecG
MCATNDGFVIAEKDLELRGPGDIEGTRQSGALNFKMADIVKDKALLGEAAIAAAHLVETDPEISTAENLVVKQFLMALKGNNEWSKVA